MGEERERSSLLRLVGPLAQLVAQSEIERIVAAIQPRLAVPISELRITDNRTVMASWRRAPDRRELRLRLHCRFLGAPTEVLAAVGSLWDRSPAMRSRARRLLRSWWESLPERPQRQPTSRRIVLRPVGEVHDLGAIRDEVVAEHFPGLEAHITWGRAGSSRRPRGGSIRLGSWDQVHRVVRIHPALDRRWVPRWLIAVIVHHELAHAAAPPRQTAGRRRRVVHHADFKRLVESHPHHLEGERWIAANLGRLLRSR